MKLPVLSITGEDAITLEDGQAVYDRVVPALGRGETVELDFAGVNVFSSPFFNAAVGQLLKDFSAAELNRLLTVSNLNALGHDVWRQVTQNAKRYYNEPNYRAAVDKVLQAMAEES